MYIWVDMARDGRKLVLINEYVSRVYERKGNKIKKYISDQKQKTAEASV